jgi:hypothetical protein
MRIKINVTDADRATLKAAAPIVGSAAAGAGAGSAVIAASGLTAAGMVGGGAGIGAAAGPVGVVIGATAGVAVYGIYRVGRDVRALYKARVTTPATEEG